MLYRCALYILFTVGVPSRVTASYVILFKFSAIFDVFDIHIPTPTVYVIVSLCVY